jgi:hypothetical protein
VLIVPNSGRENREGGVQDHVVRAPEKITCPCTGGDADAAPAAGGSRFHARAGGLQGNRASRSDVHTCKEVIRILTCRDTLRRLQSLLLPINS